MIRRMKINMTDEREVQLTDEETEWLLDFLNEEPKRIPEITTPEPERMPVKEFLALRQQGK